MYRLKVEQVLKEYDDYTAGDLVRMQLWFGRILEHTQPDAYKIDVATPDGIRPQMLSKGTFSLSYPIEVAINWNGCGGNTTDLLTNEEWNTIKANHPVVYRNCLEKVAMNTSTGSMLESWIFDFLMSDKNTVQGKPGTVIDKVKDADFGPIMKYMLPGEELNDAIIRLKKDALYVTPDNKHVFMSY